MLFNLIPKKSNPINTIGVKNIPIIILDCLKMVSSNFCIVGVKITGNGLRLQEVGDFGD
jgi:hypothetical protein